MPVKDRRAAPGAHATTADHLRRLRGALSRPLRVERHGARLRLVLVERRQPAGAVPAPSVEQVREELLARLLDHALEQDAQMVRHLAYVNDELGRAGWDGVAGLPGPLLGQALIQARMLAADEPSACMALVTERLLQLRVAAELRAERQDRLREDERLTSPEISEVSQQEFEALERGWVDTVPPGPVRPAEPH
ncbi:MAG: hypothetical protein HY855_05410 [Burkholderiales bacterium]|nr:hypothetical protein [Burkholderiales bacterium]